MATTAFVNPNYSILRIVFECQFVLIPQARTQKISSPIPDKREAIAVIGLNTNQRRLLGTTRTPRVRELVSHASAFECPTRPSPIDPRTGKLTPGHITVRVTRIPIAETPVGSLEMRPSAVFQNQVNPGKRPLIAD